LRINCYPVEKWLPRPLDRNFFNVRVIQLLNNQSGGGGTSTSVQSGKNHTSNLLLGVSNTVNSRYSGHPRDRHLVSVIARVRKSGCVENDPIFGCEISHVTYTAIFFLKASSFFSVNKTTWYIFTQYRPK